MGEKGIKEKNNRPDNSAFKQQRLPQWQPLYQPKAIITVFLILSISTLILGSFIIIESKK